MNFPAVLQEHWRPKRYKSRNQVLRETFDARVYKIDLRMDFTYPTPPIVPSQAINNFRDRSGA
jgi:hypothetical protein